MKRITIDIPTELYDWLKGRWSDTGQTIAGQVRVALREYQKSEAEKTPSK